MFKKVAGTKDILPHEVYVWQKIEEISRAIFATYNYQEIRPPIIEEAALFDRSLGEFSEVVQKQMFLIKNADEVYALRPEGTASIVRAYIENNLDKTIGFMKLYYLGPMFRLERPQKGRLRQFHHVGVEAIGSAGPDIDVEVVALADALLKAYSIENYEIKINSLGCANDKAALVKILKEGLKPKLGNLCKDCNARFKHNVLRILDCKNEGCRKVAAGLNISDSHLCEDCKGHFAQVRKGLDSLNLAYKVLPHLVRGLDYYTRTVFEINHPGLGSQDALGAGGRYDNLLNQLGGPDAGAIGFAFGVERLLLAMPAKANAVAVGLPIYLIPLGEQAIPFAIEVLAFLRRHHCAADMNYEGRSLKGALRTATNLSCQFVGIIGDNEINKGVIALKNMATGEQKEVKKEDLLRELKNVTNS